MDLRMDNETAQQAILRVLAEGASTQAETLHRILMSTGRFSPRAVANAISELRKDGLVEQRPQRYGEYRLTETGRIAASLAPKPRSLKEVVPHPGASALDLMTGRLAIGTDRDGVDRHWQIWDSVGTIPCLVSGGAGSGGTNLLSGMVEALLPHYPNARIWMVDNVGQMTEYWDRVERVAVNEPDQYDRGNAVESTNELLDRVIAVQQDRNLVLRRMGYRAWVGPFTQPRLPLGVLIVDQLTEMLRDPRLHAKFSAITKMARKTGILIATHVSSPMLESFANDLVLRDFFGLGNVLVLRHGTKLFGALIDADLASKPPIPRTFDDGSPTAGVGYMTNGTMIRTFWASGL